MEAPENNIDFTDIEEMGLHTVAIAPKAAGIWGTFCHECSQRAQEYTRCEYIKDAPEEVEAVRK